MDDMVVSDPYDLFRQWMTEAETAEPNDPNAMSLATFDPETGQPSVRIVLLKGLSGNGFVFYTNLESRKGEELRRHPKAALSFHWKSLRRQVRVEGPVALVSDQEADAYYTSRPRGSRIGAWASQQSRPLADRLTLEQAVVDTEGRFPDEQIPRPPHWSGFRLSPERIEFWRDGAFRLHDRIRYTRGAGAWSTERLYP